MLIDAVMKQFRPTAAGGYHETGWMRVHDHHDEYPSPFYPHI
ncbi:hypothetical protein [Corynebacterium sp. TAE3-ERU2]|nr:hypothetical protein [Corynebacterium sp. TAE3-ERU2]